MLRSTRADNIQLRLLVVERIFPLKQVDLNSGNCQSIKYQSIRLRVDTFVLKWLPFNDTDMYVQSNEPGLSVMKRSFTDLTRHRISRVSIQAAQIHHVSDLRAPFGLQALSIAT